MSIIVIKDKLSILPSSPIRFGEEKKLMGSTYIFSLFIFSPQSPFHIQTKEINFFPSNFFPFSLLPFISTQPNKRYVVPPPLQFGFWRTLQDQVIHQAMVLHHKLEGFDKLLVLISNNRTQKSILPNLPCSERKPKPLSFLQLLLLP